MKKLLITEANKTLLQEKFDAVHTGKEKNNILSVEGLFEIVKIAEKKVSRMLKKHLKNFRFAYSTNQPKAKAYKFNYDADSIIIEWTPKGWVLISVSREKYFATQKDETRFF